jgi:hypothetical protein
MESFLAHLPVWLLVIVFAIFSILGMFIFHGLVRFCLAKYTPGYKSDLALNIHTSVSTLLALIVAFSIVQTVANFRQSEHIVKQEAVRINNLDRLLVRYGNPELETIRLALREYAQSIVTDEWLEMDMGHHSTKTGDLFKPVSKGIIEIKPSTPRENSIYSEMLKIVDSLADSRNDRLDAAESSLPGIFWTLIIVILMLKTILSAFVERSRVANVVIATQMVAFSSLLCLTFSFDQPFKGETSIKPSAIIEVIDAISKRTS